MVRFVQESRSAFYVRTEKYPHLENWLVSGGELGYLIRNFNWSANPLGPPEPQNRRPDHAHLSPTDVRTLGSRILLADDNTDMREYVRRLLSARWRVETVADGAAGRRRLSR